MRRLALPVAMLIALACAAGAAASPVYVLSGYGWGHGVGMSQYGALGRAQNGQSYKNILGFYYDGTTVGQGGQNRIRVLLTAGRSSITLRSSTPFKVERKRLDGLTDYRAVPARGGKVRVVGKGRFASPAGVTPGTGFLRIDGLRYRGGLRIYNHGGALDVVNVVGLQAYLFSVVPREMPANWPTEALKAQAVAARSYAVNAARASWFDIYDDTRDQVYGGLDYSTGEEPGSTAAVKATRGEVVKYGGGVASTYFSSSNGGRTAASVDTWGGSVPYLVSKSDPFDRNADNPNRSWTTVLSPRGLQSRLGAGRKPTDALVTSRSSGRVNRIRLERGSWAQTFPSSGLGPEYFRSALGLRSSRFNLGVLDLTPNRRSSTCGARVRLDLLIRDVKRVSVQRRPASGGAWKNISRIKQTGPDTYRATDRPCRGTAYRLRSPAANTAARAVTVAPHIVFSGTQPAGGGALKGLVEPSSLAGQTVVVSRHDGTWKRVATATVQPEGKWRANFHVVEGVYRARISPPTSSGLVTGYSPPLTVKLS